jgi:exodeoxyribonuclease VII large subunit
LDELAVHGSAAVRRRLREYESRLATMAGKIESLSPLAVLARGYTITQDAANGKVVRRAAQLRVGQSIVTRFSEGAAISKVESIEQ